MQNKVKARGVLLVLKCFCKQKKSPRWMKTSVLPSARICVLPRRPRCPPYRAGASPRPDGALVRKCLLPSEGNLLCRLSAAPLASLCSNHAREENSQRYAQPFSSPATFFGANNSNGSFTNFHFILRNGLLASSLLSSCTLWSSRSVVKCDDWISSALPPPKNSLPIVLLLLL